MINELIKMIAVIVISAVFVTVIRNRAAEYSFVLVLSIIAVVALIIFGNLFSAIIKLKDLFNKSGNSIIYFEIALKALGISYITTFAADVCRDYGLSALAQMSEIAGKITIFTLSLPLMTAVLNAALKFV